MPRQTKLILVFLVLLSVFTNINQAEAAGYHISVFEFRSTAPAMKELSETLAKATKDDVVYIHLSSPGGSVLLLTGLYNAAVSCECKVVTINEGGAYSAGAVLLMAGDEILFKPHVETMFHRARWIDQWGQHKLVPLDYPSIQKSLVMMDEAFGWALSDEELTRWAQGEDVYIETHVLIERVLKHKNNKAKRKGRLLASVAVEIERLKTVKKKKTAACFTDQAGKCNFVDIVLEPYYTY